jgi:hypothetical protein
MTEQDWLDLDQQYRAIFGERIPRTMLPADEDAAATMVREAILKRDDSAIGQDIPPDAAI